MSLMATHIQRVGDGEVVTATLRTRLELGDLLDAESAWTPWRLGLVKQLHESAVSRNRWPEHWHWNWVRKLLGKQSFDIGSALSPYRLMGLSADDQWQGLVLAGMVGHQTKLDEGGKDLIYLDYVETAPWNLRVDEVGQVQRFKGVGRQLLELGVRLSKSMDLKGRIGLHALPQAVGFYRRCGMTDLGIDPQHQQLRYFEMTQEQAADFLNERRTS